MKRVILKTIHGIEFILIMLLYFVSFPLAFLLFSHKKYWLISEVNFDARDNGYHFFKYLNENHKEINSVFIIDKLNPYFSNIKQIGKTIKPHSYLHMLLFISATVKISTIVNGCSPSSYVTKYLLRHKTPKKNVCLKHGILKNFHSIYLKKRSHLDLVICGAKPEYDFVLNDFGYLSSEVKYTGLPRFDMLHHFKTQNYILVMPTWRRWLDKITTYDELSESDYLVQWRKLIEDERLIKMLEQSNYTIVYYVHHKLDKYIDVMNFKNPYIKFIGANKGYNLQDYLKGASLLITDFSSVYFDFAYMKKPLIYYQFDTDLFMKSHYEKGYFDYDKDGFGPVFNSSNLVIDEISKLLNSNFALEKAYLERIERFFPLNDTNNCKRVFEEIAKIL